MIGYDIIVLRNEWKEGNFDCFAESAVMVHKGESFCRQTLLEKELKYHSFPTKSVYFNRLINKH